MSCHVMHRVSRLGPVFSAPLAPCSPCPVLDCLLPRDQVSSKGNHHPHNMTTKRLPIPIPAIGQGMWSTKQAGRQDHTGGCTESINQSTQRRNSVGKTAKPKQSPALLWKSSTIETTLNVGIFGIHMKK
jgi:hypothetical protein